MTFGFLHGASYPFRAATLLTTTPRLWPYIIMPVVVNAVVAVLLYVGLLIPGWNSIDGLMAALPTWLAVLEVVFRVILVVGLVIVTALLLVQFGVILGSPWYGQLSEQLEILRLGNVPPSSGGNFFSDIWRSILFELKKLTLTLGVGCGLAVMGLALPGIGALIASIGGISLSVAMLCLDFFDPPLERRRFGFRAKLAMVFRYFPGSAGFGLLCLALVSVPLLNLITIPICVTAGTLYVCDRTFRDRASPTNLHHP